MGGRSRWPRRRHTAVMSGEAHTASIFFVFLILLVFFVDFGLDIEVTVDGRTLVTALLLN